MTTMASIEPLDDVKSFAERCRVTLHGPSVDSQGNSARDETRQACTD